MISIGMIGADSSHTEAYAGLVAAGGPHYGRAQVIKLWGEDRAQAEAKAAQCQIPHVVSDPGEAVTGVDAVVICNRYGDDHPSHARLAIEAGRPTFVDKPFTNDYGSARELAQMATRQNVPLMSCSPVRFAAEIVDLQRQLAGFGTLNSAVTCGQATGDMPNPRARHPFFYGIHPVDLLHTVLGPGAESVTTRRTPRSDVGLVSYPDGRQGVVNLLQKTPSIYHAVVYGTEGWGEATIRDFNGFYVATLGQVIAMAETGKAPFPIDWAVEVMGILAALIRSAEQGGETVRLSEL